MCHNVVLYIEAFLVYLYRQIKASQIKGNARLVEFGLVIIDPQMQ